MFGFYNKSACLYSRNCDTIVVAISHEHRYVQVTRTVYFFITFLSHMHYNLFFMVNIFLFLFLFSFVSWLLGWLVVRVLCSWLHCSFLFLPLALFLSLFSLSGSFFSCPGTTQNYAYVILRGENLTKFRSLFLCFPTSAVSPCIFRLFGGVKSGARRGGNLWVPGIRGPGLLFLGHQL